VRMLVQGHRVLALCAVLLIGIAPCVAAQAPRDSTLLWDDGEAASYGNSIQPNYGAKLAVGFDAPSWAQSVIEVDLYVTSHGGDWPFPGPPDTTYAFTVCLWAADVAEPNKPGELVTWVEAGSGHPVDSWVHVSFPEPVGVVDTVAFPSGRFFVGVLWTSRFSPAVGVDFDAPLDGRTWFSDGETWGIVDDRDAMVRAVVSDVSGSAVESLSWGNIKALYD